jgi:FkbM family methyltransferase
MGLWARIEAALLDDAPKPTRVLLGPNRGSRLILNRTTQTKLWFGVYEREVQQALAGQTGMVWDIGANVGFFTLLLAKHASLVLAVEPYPENLECLHRAVQMNDAAGSVSVIDAAVSARDGTGWLAPGVNSSESRLADHGLPVRTVTLDTLLDTYGIPALVKIDIEGGEMEALRGGCRLLSHHPKLIIETHSPELDDRVRGLLGECGYRFARAANSLIAT